MTVVLVKACMDRARGSEVEVNEHFGKLLIKRGDAEPVAVVVRSKSIGAVDTKGGTNGDASRAQRE